MAKTKNSGNLTAARTITRQAFGIGELAAAIGVSGAFLRLEVSRGRLHPIRLGRRVLISAQEWQRYLTDGVARAR